jgi:hypothetical protein
MVAKADAFHAVLPIGFRFIAFYSLAEVNRGCVVYTPLCAHHSSERVPGLIRALDALLSLPRVVAGVPEPRPKVVSTKHSAKTFVRVYDKLVGIDTNPTKSLRPGKPGEHYGFNPLSRSSKHQKLLREFMDTLYGALPLLKFNEINKWLE